MRWIAAVTVMLTFSGCGIAPQPESARTVAAYEVSLPTENQRNEFLSLMSRIAQSEGLHLDAASHEELIQTAKAVPLAKMTVRAAVWRGSSDDDAEAVIMDQADHLGEVWIMFSKGEDAQLATKFRDKAVEAIFDRWPGTLSLPIMPTGAIPLHRDLVRTANGYQVAPSAAANYDMPVKK